MNEIETLKALLKEANVKIKWPEVQRVLSAANNLAIMLTFDEAIKKIEKLEEELHQHKTKNNPQTKYIINPEWEKLGPKHNVEFDVEREYKEFNIGPAPQNANLPPIS